MVKYKSQIDTLSPYVFKTDNLDVLKLYIKTKGITKARELFFRSICISDAKDCYNIIIKSNPILTQAENSIIEEIKPENIINQK